MTSPVQTDTGLDLLVETRRGTRRASLEEELRHAIRSQRLRAGVRLPSTRALAEDLGWSRGTVAAVYDQLVGEGYLHARVGVGTTVAEVVRPVETAPAAPGGGGFRLDLRPGTPDVDAFPVAAWLRSARRALANAPAEVFGSDDFQGRPELRNALVEYLGRTRGVRASPDQVVIAAGTTQILWLLCRALVDLGRTTLAMEDPCRPDHRDVAAHAGLTVLSLPVDDHGARVDQLRALSPDAAMVTPAHHYPTGVALRPARRAELLGWARESGGLVIEDDHGGAFGHHRRAVASLQGTAPEHVAYVGTASHTLCPGIRVGWGVLPRRLVGPVVDTQRLTTHGVDVTSQLTLADFITRHSYDRRVRTLRTRYARRHRMLVDALHDSALGVRRLVVDGGPAGGQALVHLRGGGPREDNVVHLAAKEGLGLHGFADHWQRPPDPPREGLVVGYSRPSDRDYPRAVAALAGLLKRVHRTS